MAKKPGFKKFRKLVATDLDTLRAEFVQMRVDLDTTRKQLDEMITINDRVVADLRLLDDRLVHMGREFANQLHELATGIDGLEKHADSVSAETVAELHDVQARLAAEQVRYEIAFRQDLAEIADQLRRLR
jgi:regulator of replication initiation timing